MSHSDFFCSESSDLPFPPADLRVLALCTQVAFLGLETVRVPAINVANWTQLVEVVIRDVFDTGAGEVASLLAQITQLSTIARIEVTISKYDNGSLFNANTLPHLVTFVTNVHARKTPNAYLKLINTTSIFEGEPTYVSPLVNKLFDEAVGLRNLTLDNCSLPDGLPTNQQQEKLRGASVVVEF